MSIDWQSIVLTLKLASISTFILLLISIPIAWWLAFYPSRLSSAAATVVALPLVLPPTVLGFYLLIFLGERGPLAPVLRSLGLEPLAFSFSGLVFGSVIYSLPFAVQSLENTFESMGRDPLEAAATLRAGPIDRFFTIALPKAKSGLISAAILSFAHTLGEFGVVLMLGGSIPGETKVISIAIFEHVEQMQWTEAHTLSGGMLLFSFLTLFILRRLRVRKNVI